MDRLERHRALVERLPRMEEAPRVDDQRTVPRFAWLPVVLSDRAHWWAVHWLKPYWARQVYEATDAEPWGPSFGWRTVARVRDVEPH